MNKKLVTRVEIDSMKEGIAKKFCLIMLVFFTTTRHAACLSQLTSQKLKDIYPQPAIHTHTQKNCHSMYRLRKN